MVGTNLQLEPAQSAALLRGLHHAPHPLVLPNSWDAASARLFVELGFPVVATSSRAVAASLGYPDHQGAPPEEMLAANARIARAVAVPVTADVEAGYGMAATELVERLLESGIAGLNLEDFDYGAGSGLVDIERQADYLAEVKEAGRGAGVDLVLNARIDVFLHGGGDLGAQAAETERRARRYAEAGADCVFPLGLRSEQAIERLVKNAGAPVNILSYPGAPPLARLRDLGVARISFAGGLAEIALQALRTFGTELAQSSPWSVAGATQEPS
jgi:2-methylisocitrate lyase-like PEP mutase family enzyme